MAQMLLFYEHQSSRVSNIKAVLYTKLDTTLRINTALMNAEKLPAIISAYKIVVR